MASLKEGEKFQILRKLQSYHEALSSHLKDENGIAPVSKQASDIRVITSSEEGLRRGKWLHGHLRSLNQTHFDGKPVGKKAKDK